MRRKNVENFRQ